MALAFSEEIECIEVVPGKIFHLKNVLSRETCANLCEWAEEYGYFDNLSIQLLGVNLRTSLRIENIENQEIADILTQKIHPLMPQTLEDGRTIRPVLEKFRFDKYNGGGLFRPHYDDSKFRNQGESKGESSVFTLMMWLNEGYEGGFTHFLPCKANDNQDIKIRGEPGDALVFWQKGMLHEGMKTTAGEKVIMHSNVMYSPYPGTGPRPRPQTFKFAKEWQQQLNNSRRNGAFTMERQNEITSAYEDRIGKIYGDKSSFPSTSTEIAA